MPEVDIDMAAVIVGAILNMVIGAFWYSPAGFGKKWMKLSNISKADIEKSQPNMPKLYGITFLGAIIMSYVTAHFVDFAGAETIQAGAITGVWLLIGFIAVYALNGSVWGKRPWGLYWLDVSYYLVVLAILGALHATWV